MSDVISNHPKPNLLTRFRAFVNGEVSADALEAYHNAGDGVYSLFIESEKRRAEATRLGQSSWAMPIGTRSYLAAAWIGFALQTLGDAFLKADYEADSTTVGFVPPVTAEQADNFYNQVATWVSYAAAAKDNNNYRIPVVLPVALPEFVEVEPCPVAHLIAMLAAGDIIVKHAGIAVADALSPLKPGEHDLERADMQSKMAALVAANQSAQALHRPGVIPTEAMHERIEAQIKGVITDAFLLGQIAAMPDCLRGSQTKTGMGSQQASSSVSTFLLPGQRGFDKFCLTAPESKPHFTKDAKAKEAMTYLWKMDPDPSKTLRIQSEILDAVAQGHISYKKDGRNLGCYYCCPWSAIYHVRHPVTINGTRLRPGQDFTYDVSAEGMEEGEEFKREILVGNFSHTDKTDYCTGDDDDD